MHPVSNEQFLDRYVELGMLGLEVLVKREVIVDKNGRCVGTSGKRVDTKSKVVMKIYTILPGVEAIMSKVGNGIDALRSGDNIELIGTEHNAHATGIFFVRNKYEESDPDHRRFLTFSSLKHDSFIRKLPKKR